MAGWVVVLVPVLVLGAPQHQEDPQDQQCMDLDYAGFWCVPIYQCSNRGVIKTKAAGLFDPGSNGDCADKEGDFELDTGECCPPVLEAALSAWCLGSLDVCCLHPNSTSQYEAENIKKFNCGANGGQIGTKNKPREPEVCIPNKEDCEVFGTGCCTKDEGQTGEPRIAQPSCGLRNPLRVDEVPVEPGVSEASFGEWPHVCAILKLEFVDDVVSPKKQPLKIYQCGASLIDDGVLLTAAHCLNELRAYDLVIRCGEWNTQNEDELLPHQERVVVKIRIHPHFNPKTFENNFALLFVGKDFEMADNIQPVCLPKPCAVFRESENCVANGWGRDKFGSDGRYATTLKEVVYPLVPHHQCQSKLRETRLGRFFELADSFVCAGGIKGVSTCKGDGGGPLACRIQGSNRWVQAGIISWSIGCGKEGHPSVFANVATASCWIDNEVKKHLETEVTRFGFLQSVDCLGAAPATDCTSGDT